MRRPSVICLFLIMGIYASAGLMGVAGVYDWTDHQVEIADEEEFNQTIEESFEEEEDAEDDDGGVVDSIQTAIVSIPVFGAAVESLHGIYSSVSGVFGNVVAAIQYGPAAVGSIPGVSSAMVTYLTAGLTLIVGIDTIYVISGRRL